MLIWFLFVAQPTQSFLSAPIVWGFLTHKKLKPCVDIVPYTLWSITASNAIVVLFIRLIKYSMLVCESCFTAKCATSKLNLSNSGTISSHCWWIWSWVHISKHIFHHTQHLCVFATNRPSTFTNLNDTFLHLLHLGKQDTNKQERN